MPQFCLKLKTRVRCAVICQLGTLIPCLFKGLEFVRTGVSRWLFAQSRTKKRAIMLAADFVFLPLALWSSYALRFRSV